MEEKFDVIVIGSGPAGYVAAIRCAQLGLKTACVEKGPLGGTCLNVGCIPSKALLHSSELYYSLDHQMKNHGIEVKSPTFNFAKMMERKTGIVKGFNQGIEALFKRNQIVYIQGQGKLVSLSEVAVGEKIYQGDRIILATGSEPIVLSFLPIDEKRVVTSTGALSLEEVPKKLVVIGAGVIGVELGSVYNRLGSTVTFIEFLPKICPTLDAAIAKSFQQILGKQGLDFHLETKVVGADIRPNQITIYAEKIKGKGVDKGETQTFEADVVLCSIGRRPYTNNLGLDEIGVKRDEKGFVLINGRFETSIPSVYAIGDIVDGPMLAHKASEEGVAVAELISGLHPRVEYITIPNVVYTDPEVATVGLTEEEAKKYGLKVKIGTFPFAINSRAQCTGEQEGLVKIVAEAKSDRILGIHIVGAKASEIIAEAVLAIENKLTALELANTVHAHPTLSEAVKEAALAVHKRSLHK